MVPTGGLAPDAIITLPHGARARWNEFVTLSGKLTPEPAPFEVTKDDLIVALTHLALREGLPKEALRAQYLQLKQKNSIASFSVTAELAQILLESETAIIHSTNPDKTFRYHLEMSLLDARGSRFREDIENLEERPEAVQEREKAFLHRRQRRENSRKEDLRTFRIFATLPDQVGRMNEAYIEKVENHLATTIQRHFRGASVRQAFQKTDGGRDSGDLVFYVCPREDIPIAQFVHVTGALNQPPLTDLKYVDVGPFHPAVLRMPKQLRSQLQIKGCCLRHECVAHRTNSRPCDRQDLYYEQKRQTSASDTPSFGAMMHRERQEAKRQKIERSLERQRQEVLHFQSQCERDREANVCRAWTLGRCSRDHPQLHGSPEESAAILCCSIRVPGAAGYSKSRTECPFARFTDRVCIYAHMVPGPESSEDD